MKIFEELIEDSFDGITVPSLSAEIDVILPPVPHLELQQFTYITKYFEFRSTHLGPSIIE